MLLSAADEIITSPPERVRGIVTTVSVCPSTRLCMLTAAVARSVLLWRRCDMFCTSGFVDDVMSSYSGPYGVSYVKLSSKRIA